jgi:cytochrome c-type biogenesis protein CcmF
MEYIGEHLLPGKLGHFFVVLSFTASFVAFVAYFLASRAKKPEEEKNWKLVARTAFAIDFISVFAVFACIYYIISAHYFEYNFAWEHSSRSLPPQYLLTCIWEAQEGSFLLWTMWHCVLGTILIFKAKKWEAPVMTVVCLGQFCLATMILGVYFSGFKIGINPFLLVRQLEAFSNAPIFSRADYLSIPQMQDGQSLNALLQNYWMVIHPPVLFCGFASTIIPFGFAISGLWTKQYGDWTKAALPWTLFSACVLGTGVLMGAAWAYESLTFGGYWAWDPVENASLVPWLVLIGGLHTLIVYRSTGHSLRATYVFLILQYVLVLYATFLTRSGILGDLSVHAFVDSGMNWQLILFILVFLTPAAILLIKEYKRIPHIQKEEHTYSREFWMFIGALVLFLSALFIITVTSLPVFNKVLGTHRTTGEDPEFYYNRVEIFIAIIIGILTAVTQYLKYKQTPVISFVKKIVLPTSIALVLAVLYGIFGGIHYDKYGTGFLSAIYLALFCAIYAVVANAGYIWVGLHGKLRAAGASVAHVGFGLMLVGILISSSKKQVLSYNTTGININFDPAAKQNPLENLTLLKNVQTDMGTYWATFLNNDSTNKAGNIMYFRINFQKKQGNEAFDLYPNLIKNTKGQESFSNNPDKRHYWNRDIFTYISYASTMDREKDTSAFKPYPMAVHDTVFYSKGYLVLNKVVVNPNTEKFHFSPSDTALMAEITVVSKDSMRYQSTPLLYVKDNKAFYVADTVFAQNLVINLGKILDKNKIQLMVRESSALVPFVALKVYEFPQINLLWIGALIMIAGFIMSIVRRAREILR